MLASIIGVRILNELLASALSHRHRLYCSSFQRENYSCLNLRHVASFETICL